MVIITSASNTIGVDIAIIVHISGVLLMFRYYEISTKKHCIKISHSQCFPYIMYLLIVIVILTAVEANQEFTCKPQPGCHFARCSPLWPVTVPALRERNEFPINCVKNGTDPKDEDQDKALESHKQKISELTNELTEAKEIIKELKTNSDETIKVMANQTETISMLTDDAVKASDKINELEKRSDVTSKEMTSQTENISKLTDKVLKANEKIEELEKNSDFCAFTYRGKCFWFEMYDGLGCYRASQICAARGGKPANIYSKYHYYMLLEYLRTFAETIGYVHAWLGVKYNPKTHVVSLSDGSTATFVKWYTTYPRPAFSTCMYLQANADPGSVHQNLGNSDYGWTRHGVVCEL